MRMGGEARGRRNRSTIGNENRLGGKAEGASFSTVRAQLGGGSAIQEALGGTQKRMRRGGGLGIGDEEKKRRHPT